MTVAGLVVLCALAVFTYTLARATVFAPDDSEVPAPDGEASFEVTEEQPARLEIPALGIDAHVKAVGVNAAGNMATPGNFTDVGWYQFGTVPGQIGSAVMDGHVDNGLALPGVFKRLADLKKGDSIYVVTKEGTRLRFVVEEVVSYPYDAVPLELLFNRRDDRRLNLVTCAGSWLRSDRTYDQRLVVYAKLAP